MNIQHVNVKFFVDGKLHVDLERFIEVFHSWVAQQAMDEMMIDVADYRHVPNGPGVMLIGLEADYSMDHKDGRWGLRYNRKGTLAGDNQSRLRQALETAEKTCSRLESEVEGLTFSRQEVELLINDRALAPNNEQSREDFQKELTTFLQNSLGQSDCKIQIETDPRKLLSAVAQLKQPINASNLATA